jgi:hypothetical protein
MPADCEPAVSNVKTFSAGKGALRNTSSAGEETRGSAKSLVITAVVELVCPAWESREVSAELATANNVGGSPPLVLESAVSRVLAGGQAARFRFVTAYTKMSCREGEGPVPKDQGGVNQVNENAFTFTAKAWSDDDDGSDAHLVCKPSRTTSSED